MIASSHTAMRAHLIVVPVVLLGGLLAGPDQTGSTRTDLSRQWRDAVTHHEPGVLDQPALDIAAWTEDELSEVRSTASRLPRNSPLLKRGALLHGDIAMSGSARTPDPPSPTNPAPLVITASDGRSIGVETAGTHWDFARELLGLVSSASRDDMVRLWYHASAAFMQRERKYGTLALHLARAPVAFRDDAWWQFFNGARHEAASMPEAQIIARTAVARPGFRLGIRDEQAEETMAERFFSEALRRDPSLTEARLRRGWMLGRLGRHREAVAELKHAGGQTQEPVLRYYAELFLGYEQLQRGDRAAARACFERASAVFPRAQSPYLALSRLAREQGDRTAALEALGPLWRLQADEQLRYDPWWDYDASAGRHAAALLTELRKPFLATRQP